MEGQPQPSPSTPAVPDSQSVSLIGTKAGDLREITLLGDVTLKQVWCPPGMFTMGSFASEADRSGNEPVAVEVTLTQGYWLAATETTQGQWTAVMGAASKPWSGQKYLREGQNFPATYISHGVGPNGKNEADSATAFCEKLTEIERTAGRLPTGWKYELPTEAQWEYACRAGTTTQYSFQGNESQLSDYAWWGGFVGDGNAKREQYSHTVGTKLQNRWGLYDMHGNVLEWCRDGYAEKLSGGSDPFNAGTGNSRVLRGGSWYGNARLTRSAYRNRFAPDFRVSYSGFRVCLSERTP